MSKAIHAQRLIYVVPFRRKNRVKHQADARRCNSANGIGWELAEARGFEPPVPISEYNDLANRRLKPLGHASVAESYKQDTMQYQALGQRLHRVWARGRCCAREAMVRAGLWAAARRAAARPRRPTDLPITPLQDTERRRVLCLRLQWHNSRIRGVGGACSARVGWMSSQCGTGMSRNDVEARCAALLRPKVLGSGRGAAGLGKVLY